MTQAATTDTEKQAIARLKQGDLMGLEALVRIYQVRAVHAALLVLHDRAQAEEIAQGCFFNAALKISQFDDRRPFGPWFLRSVINAALQEAQRQRRVLPLEEDGAVLAPANTPGQGEGEAAGFHPGWLVDPGLCPEDLVENEALYRAVWRALDQLPPNQRAAVVLRYIDDRSEAEITAELQRPLTTIKWWLHAARERLRRIVRREGFAPGQEADHE